MAANACPHRPCGYTPFFDAAIRRGDVPVASLAVLRRAAGRRDWREVDPGEAWRAHYDLLLYRARAVVFACLEAARA